MMRNYKIKIFKAVFLLLIFSLSLSFSYGQDGGEQAAQSKARQLMQTAQYEEAVPILQKLYKQAPFDKAIYTDYLKALLQIKAFKQADSLVHYMMKIRRGDPAMFIDLGRVANAEGHHKKAKEYFESVLEHLPNNDFEIKGLADAFSNAKLDDNAIKVYLKARVISQNPYAYATELSILYKRTGDETAAMNALLDKAMSQVAVMDDLRSSLLQIISEQKHGLKDIRQALNERLKLQAENPVWQQLLSWTYTLEGDYAGALKNLIALDNHFKEQGKRLLPFAENATASEAFSMAEKAYDYVLRKGEQSPYYEQASVGKLKNALAQLEQKQASKADYAPMLLKQFAIFFNHFPHYKSSDLWRQYAMVEARYNNRPDTAIILLEQVVQSASAENSFVGQCKLDMGDYYLLSGQIWNATLMYRQVNKAFAQDALGEMARFKNAKWAFYKGDFSLAQEQLSVLKASTSKLIANDALYLSVLITENIPPDSNLLPLKRFAVADLLLFKHQSTQADSLLDSIGKAWPQSPLQDDIAFLRGKTAMANGHWQEAEGYFKIVLNQFGTDVLGDDAAWQLAEINRLKLKDKEDALKYYKILIVQYPGSTFVQEARQWYRKLSGQVDAAT